MKPFKPPNSLLASASYAAARHGGAPPGFVATELALPAETAAKLERLFQRRGGGGANAMKPRFARHATHVAAALAEGGFPALPERRR
jgi:hypothetical protein